MTDAALTYSSYLRVPELVELQSPRSDEHDEMLFIIIHQTYELWFKQLLHEFRHICSTLDGGNLHQALATAGRIRTIIKTLVSQVDILETMTPLEFNAFRDRLDAASGFQSAQFREIEGVLGRRDRNFASHLTPAQQADVERMTNSPALWDHVLHVLAARGAAIPATVLQRDVTQPYVGDPGVVQALVAVYTQDAEAALLLERLLDIDEGLQEWRYRHVKMVERTIGKKPGTGGSDAAAGYLVKTLFRPVFPDLWDSRALL
jgi:tryptophan 2,3-dioxygenase